MDPLSDQDVKVTPWGSSTRVFRLWLSRLDFDGGCWDVLGGFRLWPCGLGCRVARMGGGRLVSLYVTLLLGVPALCCSLR